MLDCLLIDAVLSFRPLPLFRSIVGGSHLSGPLLEFVVSSEGLQLPSYADRSLVIMGSASALVLRGLVISAQAFEFGGNPLTA